MPYYDLKAIQDEHVTTYTPLAAVILRHYSINEESHRNPTKPQDKKVDYNDEEASFEINQG